MDHIISMSRGETRGTPNERLEALKARYVPTPNNQQQLEDGDLNKIMDHKLYEATKEGDVSKFIDALEKVSESSKLDLSLIFDQVTPCGNSLLHLASSFGNDDVMELILIHFPYLVTRKNSLEDTPLHVAVRDRRFNATKKLIHRRRDSEILRWKNKDDKSPLYLAVEKCKFLEWEDRKGAGWEILQLLLRESARDEAYTVKIQGMSPVLAAIEKRDTVILEEIIEQLPKLLHVRDENRGTPLHFAASEGDGEAVELLLEKYPYLALQTDKNGSYPIHIACEQVSYSFIRKLIEHTWPDLAEIKNKKGQNILHVAAKAGNDLTVRYILEEYRKPDIIEKLVNSKDDDGNTPLHLASMHSPPLAIGLLMADNRINLQVRNNDGNTPLHLASMHNHCEVMHSLTKDERIELWLRNNDGLTALDVAMESRTLSTENPALLGRAILIVAGVRRSKGRDVLSPTEQGSGVSKSPAEWIKDQVNTLLLVATLVASVTFTAGLTLPGGYNASGDSHPGTATMLHHKMFRVFIIANMWAMYSSILAVVVLLWGLNRDFYVAELAYHSAGPLLLMALTGMSVAFFAAITVAVSRLTWLGSLVMSVGVLYLAMVIVVLAALIFPSSKTTMFIVVFYYIAVDRVGRYVKFCFQVFRLIVVIVPALLFIFCFRPVVRVCKRIFRSQESS